MTPQEMALFEQIAEDQEEAGAVQTARDYRVMLTHIKGLTRQLAKAEERMIRMGKDNVKQRITLNQILMLMPDIEACVKVD